MSPTHFDRLKSLPLTILLTVLIWMYAEAKFTATQDHVPLTLRVVSPQGDLVLRALDPTDNRYHSAIALDVTLEGPKNQIDGIDQEAHRLLQQDAEFSTLNYVPPAEPLKVGTDNRVDTVSALNSLRYFRQRGVTVTAATPSRIRLEVDHVEPLTKPVDFRPSFAVDRFTATPEQVTVNVPSEALVEIGGADRITVNAVPTRDLTTLPPGAQQTVAVRYVVDYPGAAASGRDDRITVTPAQGEVLVVLPKHQQETVAVPDVPVWVSGPPALLGRYDVTVVPKALRVTVAGSSPVIEQLRKQLAGGVGQQNAAANVGVRAYLDIYPDDLVSAGTSRRRVRFMLPEGLTVQSGAEVEFRLLERAVATQPAGAGK